MKTLIVSLAALVAISGAALASDRGIDPRDSGANFSKFSAQNKMESSVTDSNAFAVVNAGKKTLTAFERMNLDAGKDHGRQARESHMPAE